MTRPRNQAWRRRDIPEDYWAAGVAWRARELQPWSGMERIPSLPYRRFDYRCRQWVSTIGETIAISRSARRVEPGCDVGVNRR
jgi:hypothetical protein